MDLNPQHWIWDLKVSELIAAPYSPDFPVLYSVLQIE